MLADEVAGCFAVDVEEVCTSELSAVRSHNVEAFGLVVEVYTAHHRAQYVVVGGKECTVDASLERIVTDDNGREFFDKRFGERILVSAFTHQTEGSVLIIDGDFKRVAVDVEVQGLFRNFLDGVLGRLCIDGELKFSLARNQFDVGGKVNLVV